MTKLSSFAAILLFPVLSFAQAAADPATPSASHGILYALGMLLLAHLLPIIVSLVLVTAFPAFYVWLKAQRAAAVSAGKSTTLLDIAEKVAHLAQLAVAAADANLVPDVAARAAKGELTAGDGAAIKTDAQTMVKNFLSPQGLADLAHALGSAAAPAAPAVVDAYIGAHIENAVDAKNNAAAPA